MVRDFVQGGGRKAAARPYRRVMHSSFEPQLHEGRDGPGFLSRLALAAALVIAGVGLAMWIAAGG